MEIATLTHLFKAVSDPARLRLLHLLRVEELTVGELVRVLDLPQSTVSRHLKTLKDSGLVADRPVGAATYYRAALESESANGDTPLRDSLAGMLCETNLSPADRQRLDRVLALREGERSDFFDKIGRRWDALRESCFGPTFHLEAFLHLLPREWTVADLGTGTGYLLPALARHFRRVIGVDMSEPMLRLAQNRLDEASLIDENIELRQGTLEALPLQNGEVDLAVAILMLHHPLDVVAVLNEVHRVLRPGGRMLIVELHPHENERFRTAMGDRRAGVSADALEQGLHEAGFVDVTRWDYLNEEHPEHELAPLPPLYGMICVKATGS